MSNQWYLGFGASESLYRLNREYRASIGSAPEKVQNEKLYELLSCFADDCLDQYFLAPVERIRLNSMSKKIVTGGVSAIKKTIHVTLKQVIKKLSEDDRKQLADYIDSMLIPLRESSRFPTYVAVPIEHPLREKLRMPVEQGKKGNPTEVVGVYSEAICELIEVATAAYMAEPIRMLKLGMVMNKIANVANDTITGAAQTVVRKVLRSMNDNEILGFFEFSESILYLPPSAQAA